VAGQLLLSSCNAPRPSSSLLSAPPRAAADNDVYVTDGAGTIRALRSDGTEEWTLSLPDEIARAQKDGSRDIRIDYLTARSGAELFGLATSETGSKAGQTMLFALHGKQLLWHVVAPYPEQTAAPIAIGETAVYHAGDDGALYAFSRSDGHQLWRYQVSQGPLGGPTVGADGTIYITGPRQNLHAVAPDGSQRWIRKTQP
jgi:outer membrane protein assembly factor BamB